MALVRGPRIVRNGLVLHLDAAQRTSYSGSGTTWNDLSGNRNNGTLTPSVGGPSFNSANGGSIVFDGIDDYIDVASVPVLRPSNVTVSVWFNRNNTSINGMECLVESRKSYWISYAMHINSSELNWNIGYLDVPPYAISLNSVGNYIDGNWHNAVGTYDKQNLKIYVDGLLKNTSSSFTSDILYSGTLSFLIGFHFESTTYFEGKISNTYIYNRALSASEILQNYNTTKGRFNL